MIFAKETDVWLKRDTLIDNDKKIPLSKAELSTKVLFYFFFEFRKKLNLLFLVLFLVLFLNYVVLML